MKLKLKRRAMHAISLNGEPRPGHSVDAAKPCSLFSSKANERKIYEIPMCPLPAEESKTALMELFCRPRPTVHAERRTKFFPLEEARRRALGKLPMPKQWRRLGNTRRDQGSKLRLHMGVFIGKSYEPIFPANGKRCGIWGHAIGVVVEGAVKVRILPLISSASSGRALG